MKELSLRFGLLVMALSLMAGCSLCPPVDPQYKLITQFDDSVLVLAKAVDVIADSMPETARDDQIFKEAVRRSGNLTLLHPFIGYTLKARLEDGVGIILLCSPDGKTGIVEDVSCSARIDMWRPTGSPCEYMLDVEKVCSIP